MVDFAVFILTHGRPNKVITYNRLRTCGYTGKIYLVIDSEDTSGEEYKKRFGDDVLVFDKNDIEKRFDSGDNFTDRRVIFYARNAVFDLAEKLGLKYFIQLDDDYDNFLYKFNKDLIYEEHNILQLDKIFAILVEYYKSIPALSIAFSQNGDFIGGKKGGYAEEIKATRKAMNSFICTTERRFPFLGRINEDVNTYTNLGNKGNLFFTFSMIAINQASSQKQKGGMSDIYLDNGTYLKSFYSVMYSPSCVKISTMTTKHKRIHHEVSWDNAVPKILRAESV